MLHGNHQITPQMFRLVQFTVCCLNQLLRFADLLTQDGNTAADGDIRCYTRTRVWKSQLRYRLSC